MAMNGTYGMVMLRNMQIVSTGQRSTLTMDYQMSFASLGLMTLLGLGWECLFQGIQQVRREEDWPALFALVSGIPEAIGVWFALHAVRITRGTLLWSSSKTPMFVLLFASIWLVFWGTTLGPMRAFSLRWHLDGMVLWRPHRVLETAPVS
jgi:hypothetical protein